jgi:hypothetical protein
MMASQIQSSDVNGGAKSLAAMLEEEHARNEAHKVTVEDTVDEDDLLHPPASSLGKDEQTIPAQNAAAVEEAVAATPSAPSAAPKKSPAFDVRSEELFPALGSGPKPKAPAAATWGARPSAAAALANGVAGRPQASMLFCRPVCTAACSNQLSISSRRCS